MPKLDVLYECDIDSAAWRSGEERLLRMGLRLAALPDKTLRQAEEFIDARFDPDSKAHASFLKQVRAEVGAKNAEEVCLQRIDEDLLGMRPQLR